MKNKQIIRMLLKGTAAMLAVLFISVQAINLNSFYKAMLQDKYKELWAKVEQYENEGLPKSALAVVEQILTMARSEKNTPQTYKAFAHKMKFEMQTIDNGYQHVLNSLRAEAEQSESPVKALFQSLYAEMLWNYYLQNRWSIMNRTYTGDFIPEDLSTWDARRLNEEVAAYYLKSVENADDLKKIKLEDISEILVDFNISSKLRSNAYDLLCERAISYFSASDAYLTDLAVTFKIDQPEFFAPAPVFATMQIKSPDNDARKYKVLLLFQNLIRSHLNDKSPEALVDLDLKRLQYVRTNVVGLNTDSLYLNALQTMRKQFASSEVSVMIDFELANFFKNKGNSYNHFTNPDVQWDMKKAYDICKSSAEKFPKAPFVDNLRQMMKKIENKSFSLLTETNIVPGKPALMLINYKNIEKLYFKVIDVSHIDIKKATRNKPDTTIIKYFNSLSPMKTFDVVLPQDNDYQNHSTEIIIEPLNSGKYLIMASHDKSFSIYNNKVDYLFINATSLSYIYQRKEDYSYVIYVLDRETGVPLPGVKAEGWHEEYNYTRGEYEIKRSGTWTTNNNGEIVVPPASHYRTLYFDFSKGKDKLTTETGFYQYEPYNNWKRMQTKTQFFTDRAIYRPGQTLYFKGIIYETDGEISKIKPNTNSTVTLYDVNRQKVADLSVISNEFGSFQGEFILPEGGITGQMSITNSYGTQYFRMEEYKRPKFEVKFLPIEKFFKLREKVEVKGSAMAYAGYAVDGAKVSYTVTRSTYFPFRYFWWWYPPLPAETVVKKGELTTDESGNFNIEFFALPEESVSKKYLPAFIYTVKADVTDINGETRSSSTMVHVGYKSMILSADIGEFINAQTVDTLRISATNLSGNEMPAKGKIVITSVTPDSYTVSRPWSKPDRPLLTRKQFKSGFPLYPWDNEDTPSNWKKGDVVFSTDFDTETGRKIDVAELKQCKAGWYHIKMTSLDPFGETVEYEHYFKIYNISGKSNDFSSPFWIIPEKITGEPGEKAVIIVGSSSPQANVFVCVEHKNKIVSKQYYKLSSGYKILEFPIEQIHRGNFTIHLAMTQHNRVYKQSYTVYVPHSDKKLDIRFESFRDKLLPGQEEEWKLIISGPEREKVLAEMAAVLYDASLDAFANNYWSLYLGYYDYAQMYFSSDNTFGNTSSNSFSRNWYQSIYYTLPVYEYLNTYGLSYHYGRYGNFYYDSYDRDRVFAGMVAEEGAMDDLDMLGQETTVSRTSANGQSGKKDRSEDSHATAKNGGGEKSGEDEENQNLRDKTSTIVEDGRLADVEVRTNFNETAFFYPQLKTNEKGEIIVSFTVPESLTKWKMMGFAHTQDLKTGYITNSLVTQKDLMVMPNLPRFFREGDKMVLASKISNLTENTLEGTAKLMFFDPFTMKPIDELMGNKSPEVKFSAPAGQSVSVSWNISVPAGIDAVTCRITATTPRFSDGEEHTLPVLTNSMLVTESMPLPIRSKQTKTFTFNKLINSGKSETLRHHNLVLEFTANPAWYAVQALPYMMEYPYECAEQVFARYYANILASHIVNSKPEIKKVFDQWLKYEDSEALLSKLEKNQELKALLLEETPWAMQAKNESERKRRVALLFDLNKMSKETDKALRKLMKMQKSGGGWVWFEGFPPDRYISQHIICGFGHLDHLGVMNVKEKNNVWQMVANGVSFIDREIATEYQYLKRRYDAEELKKDHLSYMAIHYLYSRSFFLEYISIPKQTEEAYAYFKLQAQEYWLNKSLYSQGMIALALHRNGDKVIPAKILKSLDERSIKNEEMGMFWQENIGGYYWYQAPIETQAILIEAFYEVGKNTQTVDDLKTWLLKQKQVQDWKTTKATTEAVYVLLLTGTDWLQTESNIEITIGNEYFNLSELKDHQAEAGTGYFKTSWSPDKIKPEMGTVKVSKNDEGVSWGALYWQYFEQLDKITPHETPLMLNKKLFIERITEKGKVLEEITEGGRLKVGDKVIVRIELRVDRDMEYVHMKDMRAAGFEPINVLSSFKYQDGLGYYESTRDAATNFFISYMPKGTYVFEYPMRAGIAGNFSNGITTIQCMYAPEFTSHSEGIRVNILP